MVGRGHTNETLGLLNVNSTHLNTLFDGRSWSYQRNRGVVKHLTTPRFHWYEHDLLPKRVFKCTEFTFNNPAVSLV
jgi:hypothetical protein